MVVNFVCRASKADKSGLSPLEVSIIINGARRYVHLDRKVKAADFNAKTQKVVRLPLMSAGVLFSGVCNISVFSCIS